MASVKILKKRQQSLANETLFTQFVLPQLLLYIYHANTEKENRLTAALYKITI